MSALSLPYMKPLGQGASFSFFAMPKELLTSRVFAGLHRLAKLLYSMMLDRLSLSARREDFTDQQGRVYVIYTIDQVQQDLHCARATAVKLLRQLTEWGLIEKRRRGQGRPNLLYIKDFRAVEEPPAEETSCPESLDSKSFTSRSQAEPAFSQQDCHGKPGVSFLQALCQKARKAPFSGLFCRFATGKPTPKTNGKPGSEIQKKRGVFNS